MRYQRIVLTTIALIALATGSVVAAEPSEADLVTSCTGTASNVTVPGDLFVPAGRSCELTSVVVNGNTTVRAGANLLLTGSTLNGSLTVQADGFASASGATVTGATRLNTAFGAFSENSSFGGNVVAADSGFFYSLGSSLQAVTSSNGETYLESVRMSRNLTTAGDLLTDVYNSVVQGTVSVTAASMGSVLCVSEIDGNASFSGSGAGAGGILQVGASAPLTGCGLQRVRRQRRADRQPRPQLRQRQRDPRRAGLHRQQPRPGGIEHPHPRAGHRPVRRASPGRRGQVRPGRRLRHPQGRHRGEGRVPPQHR